MHVCGRTQHRRRFERFRMRSRCLRRRWCNTMWQCWNAAATCCAGVVARVGWLSRHRLAVLGEDAQGAEARNSAAAMLIVRQLEGVFPVGKDELCDVCGKAGKTEGDRFCSQCRMWLMRFAQTTNAADAVKDLARCLAMTLRYGKRPDETAIE
jgi:hypothetical protein